MELGMAASIIFIGVLIVIGIVSLAVALTAITEYYIGDYEAEYQKWLNGDK